MTLLTAETMKWAIGQGFGLVNLSTGKDQSKLRWKPTEILFHNAQQSSPTMRSRFTVPVYEALHARLYAVARRRRLVGSEKGRQSPAMEPLPATEPQFEAAPPARKPVRQKDRKLAPGRP